MTDSSPVHSTPGEFENGVFTLKTHQMFSSTLRRRNLKTQQSPVILDLCLRKTRSGKCRRFRKAPFLKCFLSTPKRKAGVFKFLRSEKRFRKVPFSRISVDGRPNHRNKAAFSNFSGVVWTFQATPRIGISKHQM